MDMFLMMDITFAELEIGDEFFDPDSGEDMVKTDEYTAKYTNDDDYSSEREDEYVSFGYDDVVQIAIDFDGMDD